MQAGTITSMGRRRARGRVFLAIGLVAGCAATVVDLVSLDRPLLDYFSKSPPAFDGAHILKTCLIALGAASLVAAVVQFGAASARGGRSTRHQVWDGWGTQRLPSSLPADKYQRSASVKQLSALLVVLTSVLFAVVFLVTPQGFASLGAEDRPVELASAAMLLLSSAMFLYVAVVAARQRMPGQLRFGLVALGFAFVFFLIGMEEISWFQRALDIGTPELFEANRQGELNLHNFATRPIENVYYFSSFVFLIGVPFLVDHDIVHGDHPIVKTFAPSLFIAFIAALFVPYSYEMWNGSFTQLAFFVTLVVLSYYAWATRRDADAWRLRAVLAVFLLSQIVFLAFGDRLVRSNGLTEYKEFLIPVSYLLYTFEVVGRVHGSRSASSQRDLVEIDVRQQVDLRVRDEAVSRTE